MQFLIRSILFFFSFFFVFFFLIGARKLRLLAFVATLVRALAPHPISGWNRRFGIPTLDLIFLQHGCLERTKEQGDISFSVRLREGDACADRTPAVGSRSYGVCVERSWQVRSSK